MKGGLSVTSDCHVRYLYGNLYYALQRSGNELSYAERGQQFIDCGWNRDAFFAEVLDSFLRYYEPIGI